MYFIGQIKDEKIFSVFPLVSTTGNPCDPYLRLSNHFLITNRSNPKLILDYIESTRAQDIHNYPDLLNPQFERISDYASYYRAPYSYPPSYRCRPAAAIR